MNPTKMSINVSNFAGTVKQSIAFILFLRQLMLKTCVAKLSGATYKRPKICVLLKFEKMCGRT